MNGDSNRPVITTVFLLRVEIEDDFGGHNEE